MSLNLLGQRNGTRNQSPYDDFTGHDPSYGKWRPRSAYVGPSPSFSWGRWWRAVVLWFLLVCLLAYVGGYLFQRAYADDFKITIDDKSYLLGITAAREAYNAALPDATDEKGNAVNPKPNTLGDNQAYLQMVTDAAARSYAKQHGTDVADIDAKISELQAKKAEIEARK